MSLRLLSLLLSLLWFSAAIIPVAHSCPRELTYRRHDRHLWPKESRERIFPPNRNPDEQLLVDSFDNASISTWSHYYTHGRVLAGQNKSMAQWTAERWAEYGFETRLDEYYVYMNYPVDQSVKLTYADGSTYEPTLEEGVLDEDETTSYPDRIPPFHGYSHSGEASAEYVYVGRGHRDDFDRLRELGVELEGKVALAKYGGLFRGLKVKNAQEYGMIGIVMFTDPGDDGDMTEAKGEIAYPDGPARNPTSIQRGSVVYLSTYPGDPTTPGYPSKKGSPRKEKATVPGIPSLPISWAEAKPLLQALDGHGIPGDKVNRTRWVGGISDVTYSTGPAPGSSLGLKNIAEDKMTTIWNTIGIINGTNQDEVVIVGNHRDAWMVGGAADPHSGSAIMIELAKAFDKLIKSGWKPKRTIVFASWDAEEYGLVGSTEWVEEYIPWLKQAAVAYVNIDVGVSGTIPDFSASPELYALTRYSAGKTVWPHGEQKTMYDVWEEHSGEIGVLGAQSDYTAFVHRGGIASIDLGTTRAPMDPIYHTHSNYDSYHWMANFCDPGFVMHKAIGQYMSIFVYHLANDDILPVYVTNYGQELRAYFEELQELVTAPNGTALLDVGILGDVISIYEDAAEEMKRVKEEALANDDQELLQKLNHKARAFSRSFVDQGPLPNRPFYQHLIFAPAIDSAYAAVTFPGITEQFIAGDLATASEFVSKTGNAILAAAKALEVNNYEEDREEQSDIEENWEL